MGFMKSLFGNMGVQQEIPEYRIVITDVGPNPVQIISIIQKYLQSDYTELSNLINGNILDEQSTVCTLESLELLQQMQQEWMRQVHLLIFKRIGKMKMMQK